MEKTGEKDDPCEKSLFERLHPNRSLAGFGKNAHVFGSAKPVGSGLPESEGCHAAPRPGHAVPGAAPLPGDFARPGWASSWSIVVNVIVVNVIVVNAIVVNVIV